MVRHCQVGLEWSDIAKVGLKWSDIDKVGLEWSDIAKVRIVFVGSSGLKERFSLLS